MWKRACWPSGRWPSCHSTCAHATVAWPHSVHLHRRSQPAQIVPAVLRDQESRLRKVHLARDVRIHCSSGAFRRTQTAAGFPAKGLLVNASTCTIRMAIIMQGSAHPEPIRQNGVQRTKNAVDQIFRRCVACRRLVGGRANEGRPRAGVGASGICPARSGTDSTFLRDVGDDRPRRARAALLRSRERAQDPHFAAGGKRVRFARALCRDPSGAHHALHALSRGLRRDSGDALRDAGRRGPTLDRGPRGQRMRQVH